MSDWRSRAVPVEEAPAPTAGWRSRATPVTAESSADEGPSTFDSGTPTLGAGGTAGAHLARHGLFGLGDKFIAALAALQDKAHDKTGKATLADAYKRNLAFNDKVVDASDEEHPAARWAGNLAGLGASTALLAPLSGAAKAKTLLELVKQGAKTGAVLGGVGGFGASRADNLEDTAKDTGLGALTGTLLGAGAPLVGAGVSRAAEPLKNLAGKLKVQSLHPTPTLGEAMGDLPGGKAGVGRELLERGLGGLTKHGTATQIDAASRDANQVANRLAQAYDSSGGGPVDIAPALFGAQAKALELQSEPTTRAAGQKLEGLLTDYADKYRSGTTTAEDALRLKRALGKEAYGARQALQRTGETIHGDYGKGVATMERTVDDALDGALGPQFADANLRVRRLMGASQAADRSAGKSLHPVGLLPTILGAAAYGTHGAEGGAAATLATMLLHKYGSQAGARALYTLANGLDAGASPGLGALSRNVSPQVETLLDLFRRNQQQPQMTPAYLAQETP